MAERNVIVRRVWITLGCVLALAAGIALAYWQWTRYESASGTLQNLGYVLQWPMFGLFPVIMVWRIYLVAKREFARRAEENGAVDDGAAERQEGEAAAVSPPEPAEPPRSTMAYVPPTVDATADEDGALAEYNALLGELSAEDTDPVRTPGAA